MIKNLITKVSLAAFIPCLAITTPAVNLVNGDFEDPSLPSGGYQYLSNGQTVNGWTATDDGVGERSYFVHENRYSPSTGIKAFGNQAFVLNAGTAIQTTLALTAGMTYELSVWGFSGKVVAPLQVQIGNFTTELLFGNWKDGLGQDGFYHRSFQFTADQTDSSAVLRLTNQDPGPDWRAWTIDNIQVQAVPEGGSALALFGLGIAGLAFLRRVKSA